MQESSSPRSVLALLAICFFFLTIGFLRLNDVSIYTPDSVRYLIWGNSLVHGKGFVDDTQPDPDRFIVNAPLYALLLTPVELVFPMNVYAAKCWTLLWGVVALVLLYVWLCRTFSRRVALLGTFLLACNPAMVVYSTEMLSEAPFIAWILAVFILGERLSADEGNKRPLDFVVLVVFLSFISLLREVGIVMVIAAALYFWWRGALKRAIIILVATGIVSGLWYYRNQIWVSQLQGPIEGNLSFITRHYVTEPGVSLVSELALRMWLAAKVYFSQFGEMFLSPMYSRQLSQMTIDPARIFKFIQAIIQSARPVILFFSAVLTTLGMYVDMKRSVNSWLRFVFSILFLGVILIYPVHDIRFLLPLFPLLMYWMFSGAHWLAARPPFVSSIGRRRVATIASAALLIIPNVIGLHQLITANMEYRSSRDDLMSRHHVVSDLYLFKWHLLSDWIEKNVPKDAVIASPMKDLVVFAGGRKVIIIDRGASLGEFERLLRDNRVQYLLAVVQGELNLQDFVMAQSRRFWFQPIFDAGFLHLLRIHSQFLIPPPKAYSFSPADTLYSVRSMREGRDLLMAGKYELAESTLVRAYRSSRDHPLLAYYALVSSALAEDSATAAMLYQDLRSLPQTLSYTLSARSHFDVLKLVMTSKRSSVMEERGIARQRAASLCWEMGYYMRAAELLEPLLRDDPGYFVGLLWGLHYNLQNKDTAKALLFFSKLERIDSTHVLVQSYRQIIGIGGSLALAGSDSARSNLHCTIAAVYDQMDLKEEALDETEQALRYNPNNSDAMLLMAKVFERKGRPRAAIWAYRQVLLRQPQQPDALARTDALSRILSSR